MSGIRIPRWYRWSGAGAAFFLRLVRSPRVVAPLASTDRSRVWIHGASLGELKGAVRLASALSERGCRPFLTSTTNSGLEMLRARLPDCASTLLPLDHGPTMAAFLDAARPRRAIFLEAEAWPACLRELSARRVPVAFAAFRASPKSMRRWRRFSRIFPGWTDCVATVWTGDSSWTKSVTQLGFADVRPGAPIKWAGVPPLAPRASAIRSAAVSLHLRDLLELRRLVESRHGAAWLWFPRRLATRGMFRKWAILCGLRPVEHREPAPGEVWIADRFGMAHELLPECRFAWVSPGHDTEEPARLGVAEIATGIPSGPVEATPTETDRVLAEIVAWALASEVQAPVV